VLHHRDRSRRTPRGAGPVIVIIVIVIVAIVVIVVVVIIGVGEPVRQQSKGGNGHGQGKDERQEEHLKPVEISHEFIPLRVHAESLGPGCRPPSGRILNTVGNGTPLPAFYSQGQRSRDRMTATDADIRHQIVALLPRLRRFALTLAGTRDAADDVLQSACEKALARLDQFTPGTRLDSWMFQIVRTTFIDHIRRHQRRQHADLTPELVENLPSDARIHEQTAARADLAIVRAEIAQLPDEQREVLALVTIDGLSYQEAAGVLGVPIGTVMSRLSRARRKLARALDEPAPNRGHSGGIPQ
jgi:RNA polymerase sigma-70 factor (ECF subfamily)